MDQKQTLNLDMDDHFSIEIFAPRGIEGVRAHLPMSPVVLSLAWSNQADTYVLHQDAVGDTGFFFEDRVGDSHIYGAHGPTKDIKALSLVLCSSKLSHRIELVIHELDEDEIFLTHVAEGDNPIWRGGR